MAYYRIRLLVDRRSWVNMIRMTGYFQSLWQCPPRGRAEAASADEKLSGLGPLAHFHIRNRRPGVGSCTLTIKEEGTGRGRPPRYVIDASASPGRYGEHSASAWG
jgi:hypothetical protein